MIVQMVDFQTSCCRKLLPTPTNAENFFCKTIIDVQADYNHDDDNDDSDDENLYNEDDSDGDLQGDCRQTQRGRG